MAPSNSKLIAELMNNSTTINTEAIPNGSGVSVGSVIPFGGTTAPTGFLACDGAYLDRTVYADLFGAIGTTWGTTTSDNFRLPDLRDKFIRGSGNTYGVANSQSHSLPNRQVQGNQNRAIYLRTGTGNPVWWSPESGVRSVFGFPRGTTNNSTNDLNQAREDVPGSPNGSNARVVLLQLREMNRNEVSPANTRTLYIIKY